MLSKSIEFPISIIIKFDGHVVSNECKAVIEDKDVQKGWELDNMQVEITRSLEKKSSPQGGEVSKGQDLDNMQVDIIKISEKTSSPLLSPYSPLLYLFMEYDLNALHAFNAGFFVEISTCYF